MLYACLYLAAPDWEGRQETAAVKSRDFGVGGGREVGEAGTYVCLGLLHADGRNQRGIMKQLLSKKKRTLESEQPGSVSHMLCDPA